MKLGTHNSMSYLTPKKWWMRPFHFIAKCQSKPIDQQYKLGAKMFDLRVAYTKDGEAEFRHGAMAFKGNVEEVLQYLNSLTRSSYIRLILEVSKGTKYREQQEKLFINDCRKWEETYTHLKFFCGRRKYDWVQLYKFKIDDIEIIQKISSMTGTVLDDWFPLLYATFYNKKNLEKYKDSNEWLLIDFIK